ncbi:MAG: hypothetical protein EAZ70_08650 [Runella slithyformis]|jgi:hypothetical protein|nr:MAG: hypothetical protein EAZ70_08650 [Runella slithyformis]TAG23748.1 MAG: hypothetical protein EAZ38_02700 [Cytophagales bacterium]TAG43047.1 MAG: hypothetical protein EAZ32_00290 [Cytophagia bacterium]TAF45284.1 MAG: hypothetical protein EAZ63_11180 [Runella slithyformis]TAG76492.1 MAG: hypothetical protein EAZ22_17975 [Cytophagales bacterium]
MQVTYHLTEAEFDQNVFEAIKKAFKNRLLKISVVAEENNNVNFESKIEAAQQAEYEYHLSTDELKTFIESSIAGQLSDDNKFKRPVVKRTSKQPA